MTDPKSSLIVTFYQSSLRVAVAVFLLAGVMATSAWAQSSFRSTKYLLQEPREERPRLELDQPVAPESQTDMNRSPQESDETFGKQIPAWPAKTIQQIQIDIRETEQRIPADRSFELSGFGGPASRPTSSKVFAWAAPDIRYQPLYFEDVALERYLQTRPPFQQSVASGLHFFKSLVLLPHQMRHDHPASCDYPLGFCRPGNQIPYTIQRQYFGRPR
ncbi:MAG: hypothetical protein AAFN77_16305 [Planctomycetota bacterium]